MSESNANDGTIEIITKALATAIKRVQSERDRYKRENMAAHGALDLKGAPKGILGLEYTLSGRIDKWDPTERYRDALEPIRTLFEWDPHTTEFQNALAELKVWLTEFDSG